MKDTIHKTRLLTASTICALGAVMLPTASRADEAAVQLAASESYWCRLFPKYCGDETTPGGAQAVPDAGRPAEAPMAPSTSRGFDSGASHTGGAERPPAPSDEKPVEPAK
jgi:hypothetical protein